MRLAAKRRAKPRAVPGKSVASRTADPARHPGERYGEPGRLRSDLLRAAHRQLRERPGRPLTIRGLCGDRVAPNAFYGPFPGGLGELKSELLRDLLGSLHEEIRKAREEAVSPAGHGDRAALQRGAELLEAMGAAYLDWVDRNEAGYRLLNSAELARARLPADLMRAFTDVPAEFAHVARQFGLAASDEEARNFALAIGLLLHGLALVDPQWLVGRPGKTDQLHRCLSALFGLATGSDR